MNRFATQNGFLAWFETSAKNNTNIDTAFNTLIAHIIKLSKTMKIVTPDRQVNTTGLNVIGAPRSSNSKPLSPKREQSNEENGSQQQQSFIDEDLAEQSGANKYSSCCG